MESFLNKDFYHFKQGRFILEEIEKSQRKENIEIEDLTIEHIMPQTLTIDSNIMLNIQLVKVNH